jgi:hypothetical protein
MTIRRAVHRLQRWIVAASLITVALIALASDQRVPAPLPQGPLHVPTMWWSPESLSHGLHSLHGRVVNTTESTWENVQVSIDFRNARGESLFVRTVPLGRVRPGEPTEFTTGPVPERPEQFVLVGITGTTYSEPPATGATPARRRGRSRTHARPRARRTARPSATASCSAPVMVPQPLPSGS